MSIHVFGLCGMKRALILLFAMSGTSFGFVDLGSGLLQSDGSVADTQAAVNAAAAGDTVQIPNGRFTWSSALSVSKAIRLVVKVPVASSSSTT